MQSVQELLHPCRCSACAHLPDDFLVSLPTCNTGRSCRYVGEWRAGQADGYGVMQTAAGGRWEGPWRRGARHGRGVAVSDCGAAEFQSFEGSLLVLGKCGPPGPLPAHAPIRRACPPFMILRCVAARESTWFHCACVHAYVCFLPALGGRLAGAWRVRAASAPACAHGHPALSLPLTVLRSVHVAGGSSPDRAFCVDMAMCGSYPVLEAAA